MRPIVTGWGASVGSFIIYMKPHLGTALGTHNPLVCPVAGPNAGWDNYDTKPINLKRLPGKIENLLGSA